MVNKIGRNNKCPCKSGEKYKKCCLNKEFEKKDSNFDIYKYGHSISSQNIQDVVEYLEEEYEDHKIIDVTNLLTPDTYRPMQTINYQKKTLMVAERKPSNEMVFASRGSPEYNIIVMYKGAYQMFKHDSVTAVVSK